MWSQSNINWQVFMMLPSQIYYTRCKFTIHDNNHGTYRLERLLNQPSTQNGASGSHIPVQDTVGG